LEGLSREELVQLARAQAGRIAEQDRQTAELTARLARLERLLLRNSRNSSMAPSGDDQPGRAAPKDKPGRSGDGGGRATRYTTDKITDGEAGVPWNSRSTAPSTFSSPTGQDGPVQVRFVGSGDAFGSGGRWQTCIRLAGGGQVLLVDCGATSLVALTAQGLDPSQVDAVVLTHLHGDHFGGLPFLILDGQFSGRTAALTVAGPPGTEARLAEAMEVLFPGSSRVRRRFPLEVVELTPGGQPARIGAATVRAWEVEHASGAPSLAVNLRMAGASFGYSGDTEWTPTLAEPARGADLFAVEAYTFDRPIRYHLDYRTLREHLDDLPADRIVLTHMSASMLARLPEAELPAAHDGTTVDL